MTYAKASPFTTSAGLTTVLVEDSINIGNSLDLADPTDTASQGDILANTTSGLTIKDGVIVKCRH